MQFINRKTYRPFRIGEIYIIYFNGSVLSPNRQDSRKDIIISKYLGNHIWDALGGVAKYINENVTPAFKLFTDHDDFSFELNSHDICFKLTSEEILNHVIIDNL